MPELQTTFTLLNRHHWDSVPDVSSTYRDNADNILPVTVHGHDDPEERDEQIKQIVMKLCPFLVNSDSYEDDQLEEESPVLVGYSNTTKGSKHNTIRKYSSSCSSSRSYDRDCLQVKPLSGGLSNELFIVSRMADNHTSKGTRLPSSFAPAVLVRIHPDGASSTSDDDDSRSTNSSNSSTDGISLEVVDRDIESHLAAWLSQNGMAPIFFGRFENGRVEEFYPNVQPLSCHEMHCYGGSIARAMAKFHDLQAPISILPKPMKSSASIYDTLDMWLTAILPKMKNYRNPLSTPTDLERFVETLRAEWKWLRNELELPSLSNRTFSKNTKVHDIQLRALKFIREIVVTHMDCQSLNILKKATTKTTMNRDGSDDNKEDNEIRVIDFEYAGWNPRAADIANTFCEYCDMSNLRANYEKEYPTVEQQNEFLKAYIQQATANSASPSLLAEQLRFCLLQDVDTDNNTIDPWEIVLAACRMEIGRFSLLSHLGWSIWSILKSKENGRIHFDYVAYARHRMDGYHFAKNKFIYPSPSS